MEASLVEAILVFITSGVLFFTLHLTLWQYLTLKNKGVFFIVLIAVVSYGLILIGSQMFMHISLQTHFWTSGPLFMLLLMGYLHLYVGIERSVSIRILGELSIAEDNGLTLKNLHEIYPYDYMIRHRVNLLVETNWLIKKNEKYICTMRGENLSRAGIFLKKCYGLELTG
jgi:hypothetical protein